MIPKQIREKINQASQIEPIAVKLWERKFSISISKRHWTIARVSTKETRLRLLHWKILHNIYPSNYLLVKMGLKSTNKCDYCPNEIDFIEHFFFNCNKVKPLWVAVESLIYQLTGQTIQLSCTDVMFGYQVNNGNENNRKINHIILIGKMCIGIFRYSTPLNIICIFERECQLRKIMNGPES